MLTALLAAHSFWRQAVPAVGLPADARLDRLVAIERRIEPLPELLTALGKEAGVSLSVPRRMDGLKATILVSARPLRRTMADLASVFDAEWVPTENGYRLETTVPARNLLRRYVDAQRMDHRAATDALWRERAAISEIPWDQLPARRDDAVHELSVFQSSLAPGFAAAHARYQTLDGMISNGHQYLLGRLLRTLSDRDWNSLWEGRALYASSIAGAGAIALPENSADIVSPMRSHAMGEANPPVRVFFRIDPEAGDAQWIAMWDGGANSGNGSNGERDSDLSGHPFRKALQAWSTDIETGKAPELDRPLKHVDPLPLPSEGPWANESDTLTELHRQSGLDIVAEATRHASRHAPGPLKETTVRAALDGWPQLGFVRLGDGALLYRPNDFWKRRAVEPPEAALRRWEARPDRGIDAMSDLVSSLTPVQARALGTMTSNKRMERIGASVAILRLWSQLSTGERARLRGGAPLQLGAMSVAAREAALAAMIDGIFEGSNPSAKMLALFDAPWNPSALGAILLFASTTYSGSTQEVETGTWWLDAPTGTDESVSKLLPQPGLELELGSARGEGLRFVVPR